MTRVLPVEVEERIVVSSFENLKRSGTSPNFDLRLTNNHVTGLEC